jgi:hypothetical protein
MLRIIVFLEEVSVNVSLIGLFNVINCGHQLSLPISGKG